MSAGNRLTAESRERALDRMAASATDGQELDVLVIGGGITGAGIALDAASRGLSTAIVEAQDWASGTSSRSSKLVHGGLRYLQLLDFALVREALRERDLLLTTLAPHLVKPIPFLYPLRHRVWERAFVGAGILLYDVLATISPGRRALPWHRHLSRRRLGKVFPGLAPKAAVGAIQYWDANVDDARFVATVLRTALGFGVHAASRTQVVELTTDGARAVNGAVLVDLESGKRFTVRARSVISSTGVWTEQTEALADHGGLRVLASKGIHIVVPRERIAGEAGLILQTAVSVLFVIPWSRYWVIGTTDTPWHENLAHPSATSADIDYVLAQANSVLADPIDRSDIVGTWAGLRPLLQPGTKAGTSSAKVSREHTVASPVPGLTVIAGGKFTTYRVMAKDSVDFALGRSGAAAKPSITTTVLIEGAQGLAEVRAEIDGWAARFGWNPAHVAHLLHRYGANVRDLVTLCESDASLAGPLEHAPAYLRAEIAYAISHEGALHLDDVMSRRTRLVYEYPNEAMDALPEVSAIVAAALGWSAERTAHELASYRASAAEAARAALAPTDEAAAAIVTGDADILPMIEPAASDRE